jgi:hypothetical protein
MNTVLRLQFLDPFGFSCISFSRSSFAVRGQLTWRKFLAHVGPGALVAIGFVDPSNSKFLSFSHFLRAIKSSEVSFYDVRS